MGLTDVYAAVLQDFPFKPQLHVHYGETVLRIPDGLPTQRWTRYAGTPHTLAALPRMRKCALARLLLCLFLVLPAWCQESPEKTVSQLYGWLKKADIQAQKRLPEIQAWLTPELYDQLTRAYQRDPSSGEFLDFDPWSNTQMGASGYRWGPARMVGGQAKVPITVSIVRGGTTRYTCVLTPGASGWRVANLVYTPDFNLLNTLKQLNATP